MNEIAFRIKLEVSYTEALDLVTECLKAEGFGVLTEIDVKATLKKKIDADFRQYTILGACNPPLAHKALESEPLVGLLLPCNVTVEATETGAAVNLINPKVLLTSNPAFANSPAILEVATDAYERLSRVAVALSAS